ncbi:MAG: hypothetical protein AAFP86_02050, partial [Planctomycetota bacterium]
PLRAAHPGAVVAILQSTDEHTELVQGIAAGSGARLVVGDLHAELAAARAAFAVSGTVLTDVLHHRLPTVVLYRISKRLEAWAYRHVLTCPYFASTNLLAGEELLPEHCFRGDGPRDEVAAQVLRAYGDEGYRERLAPALDRAAARLGPPGAVGRAAAHALAVATERRRR